MSQAELENAVRRILSALERGVPLDWTDIRVYLVVLVAAGVGSLIGAWFQAYFSKRGEIAAIKRDLDQITKIQEQIKADISGQLWVNQSIWSLKRETYWRFTSVLSLLSSALWDVMDQGFLADKITPNPRPEMIPQQERVEKILDELISLTAPSRIVLSAEAVDVLNNFHRRCGELSKQLAGGVATYSFFDSLKQAADMAYDKIIESAQRDLRGQKPESANA